MRKFVAGAAVSLVGLAGSLAAGAPARADAKSSLAKPDLAQAVTLNAIQQHQADLQTIADSNGGTRVIGSAGYENSVKYVIDQLKRAGYSPERQEFTVNLFKQRGPSAFAQVSPRSRTFTENKDFETLQYSGSGTVTAAAQAVDTGSSTSGCEQADFDGFSPGAVALIKRGTCTYETKAANAQAAGASAVVIYNDGAAQDRTGLLNGTLGRPFALPVLGTTSALGNTLVNQASQRELRLRIKTDTTAEQRKAYNVIAETQGGRSDNVVLVGAHLDSVDAGPGINDNASGAATVLEVARQMGGMRNINNKVRFVFFGAEEEGLLGSAHYVDSLSQAERDKIALMLDFDMLGSPNFARFVYDGNGSLGAAGNAPMGSGAIEKTFNDYFAAQGLATEPVAFDGRSDYAPFTAVGIPAGGLFTGAEGTKTAEEAAMYGGTAGQPYDPCYHQACDTVDNVNPTVLDQMADAAAAAVETFADSTLTVNGVSTQAQDQNQAQAEADAAGAQSLPRMGEYWVR